MQGGLQHPSGVLAIPKTEQCGGTYLRVPCSWCHLPGSSLGRMQGVPSGWTASAREREDTWDWPWQGQVCVLLFDNRFYTLSQTVFKVQDAYSWLHRISITSFCFLGKTGCFLLSNSVVILSTWSSGLGAINILCRSGECKPVFHFYGDLNWMVAVS